ncbi:hypothetical protein ACPCHT_17880 [Nucisporomicrobium flavum]|uniref:hypothetical protein n=1 Tax=Nucisporomicrobium flavum TaxID=2785915 RepID=UPI003C2B57AD
MLRRYVLPEIVGTVLAVAAASALHRTSPYAAAWAGSIAEGIGYYGTLLWRDTRGHRGAGRLRALVRQVPGTLVEFGTAEALDTLLVRPALMYAGPVLVGDATLGVVAGKLAADLVFYLLVFGGRLARLRLEAGSEAEAVQDLQDRVARPAARALIGAAVTVGEEQDHVVDAGDDVGPAGLLRRLP